MNFLVRHIEYLLRSGDGCVLIPGLGAVISRRIPARYDSEAGRILPPTREYSFNSSLTHTDGTLAASVARARGINFEQAARMVDDAVVRMRKSLREGTPVSLGRVGSIVEREGRTLFIPFAGSLHASPDSWMTAVSVKPLLASPAASTVRDEDEAGMFSSAIRTAWRRNAVRASRIAASVALVLALGFAVAMTLGRTAPETQNASLGFEFSAPASKKSPLISRPGTSSSPLVLVLRTHDDAVTTVDTTKIHEEPAPVRIAAHDAGSARFCLIVASLTTREEAERFVRKGSDLRILEKDGRFRVYAASGGSSSEVRAKAAALGLDDRYPGAWICRR